MKPKDSVLNVLKKEPFGLNISQTAIQAKVNRATATHWLARLAADGTLDVRIVGTSKVYVLKKNARN